MPDCLAGLTLLETEDLVAGDVLLYHFGLKTIEWPLAKLIYWFTNSQIAHVALYLGDNKVAEADEDGVVEHEFSHSMNKSDWAIVRRIPSLTPQPVLNRAHAFLKDGIRYAYENLLILTGISLMRERMRQSETEEVDKWAMEAIHKAEEFLKWCNEHGRKALTCSAFVAACFNEGSPSCKLDLPIGGGVEGQVPAEFITPEDILQTTSLLTIGKVSGRET